MCVHPPPLSLSRFPNVVSACIAQESEDERVRYERECCKGIADRCREWKREEVGDEGQFDVCKREDWGCGIVGRVVYAVSEEYRGLCEFVGCVGRCLGRERE